MISRFCTAVSVSALLISALPAVLPSQSLTFGLMAGGSLSTFTGDLADDAKNHATFIAGGFLHASMAGFAVEPGLFYTRKGAESDLGNSATLTNQLSYIQVPLVVRLALPLGAMRLYVGGGPAIGVKIGCRYTVAGASSTSIARDCEDVEDPDGETIANSTEMSAVGVAGLDFGKLSIGLRYDAGLTKPFKSLGDLENPELKTRTISAVASIRF